MNEEKSLEEVIFCGGKLFPGLLSIAIKVVAGRVDVSSFGASAAAFGPCFSRVYHRKPPFYDFDFVFAEI